MKGTAQSKEIDSYEDIELLLEETIMRAIKRMGDGITLSVPDEATPLYNIKVYLHHRGKWSYCFFAEATPPPL